MVHYNTIYIYHVMNLIHMLLRFVLWMLSRNRCTNQCWGVVIVLPPRVLDECDFVCELFVNVTLFENYLIVG